MENKRSWPAGTNVIAATYEPTTKELKVTFKSRKMYRYDNVPAHVWEDMRTSQSGGKFLNDVIKPTYPATQVYQ